MGWLVRWRTGILGKQVFELIGWLGELGWGEGLAGGLVGWQVEAWMSVYLDGLVG